MIRRIAPLCLLALLSACAGQTLSQCDGPSWQMNAARTQPQVYDDGSSTVLSFPGNVPIPTIYVVNQDGKEAVADYTVEQGGTVIVHSVDRELKLREGNKVACITNEAFNPVGNPTGTGTTSPDVVRAPASGGRH